MHIQSVKNDKEKNKNRLKEERNQEDMGNKKRIGKKTKYRGYKNEK